MKILKLASIALVIAAALFGSGGGTMAQSGSYQQTCKSCNTTPYSLTCQCQTERKEWVKATLDFPCSCYEGRIENSNGRLACPRDPKRAKCNR